MSKPDDRFVFVSELPLVMERAFRLGLFKTGHALHDAVRAAGFELAEKVSGECRLPKRKGKR